ncbi:MULTISPECIES: transcriptional regulator [Comamonadaceae]|uniref:transcriptional regulator n=2 Tax=Burkholderiales TaxID=80840 RepID=UPI0020447961|nr:MULTISPECIES: transcriptional regulator [Comamonadaceae]MCM3565970.1 transcriptional regulator [Hydrogenophaga intermedia]
MAMVHDFTLVCTLNPEVDSLDEVLHRLAASDCADVTVGWGRPGYVALAFSREAFDHDAAVAQAVAQIAQILTGASLVRVEAGSP